MRHRRIILFPLIALLGACGGRDAPATDGGGTETETGGILTVTETAAPTSSGSDGSITSSTASGSDTTGVDPTGGGGGGPIECEEGVLYECGDGEDNDGDGLVDLADPECVGPCDDDEKSFQTGIPGDNVDCFQDCFFDGNSGHEDDNCWWNITCDPANPGEGGMCEYADSSMCNMEPPYDNDLCAENCLGNTPNGCDCFGCCTVTVDGQKINIYLGGADDCSVDNLEACTSCTKNEFCDNPCEPEKCEVCVGGDELPEGCDDPGGCDNDMPCTVDDQGESNCPDGYYCLTGCCALHIPPP